MSTNFDKQLKELEGLILSEKFKETAKLFRRIRRKTKEKKKEMLASLKKLIGNDKTKRNSKLACKMLRSKILYESRVHEKDKKKKKEKACLEAENVLFECTELEEDELKPLTRIAERIQIIGHMPGFMRYAFLKWWFWIVIGGIFLLGKVLQVKGNTTDISDINAGLWYAAIWPSIILILLIFVHSYYRRFNRIQRELIKKYRVEYKKGHCIADFLFSKIGLLLPVIGSIVIWIMGYVADIRKYINADGWNSIIKWALVGDLIMSTILGLFIYIIGFYFLNAIKIVWFFWNIPREINWKKIWINATYTNPSGDFGKAISFLMEITLIITFGASFIIVNLLGNNYYYASQYYNDFWDFINSSILDFGAYPAYFIGCLLLPIVSLIFVLIIPLIIYAVYIRKYKQNNLAHYIRKRDVALNDTFNKKQVVDYDEEDLEKLIKHEYFVNKIRSIKTIALSFPTFLKALTTLLPTVIKLISELVAETSVGNTSIAAAIITTIIVVFIRER
ncbi:MAG: hypothetical protein ACTSO7_16230 [Candidatus Heimdallarchaeota archaeon]